jgi:hypothetical protein
MDERQSADAKEKARRSKTNSRNSTLVPSSSQPQLFLLVVHTARWFNMFDCTVDTTSCISTGAICSTHIHQCFSDRQIDMA